MLSTPIRQSLKSNIILSIPHWSILLEKFEFELLILTQSLSDPPPYHESAKESHLRATHGTPYLKERLMTPSGRQWYSNSVPFTEKSGKLSFSRYIAFRHDTFNISKATTLNDHHICNYHSILYCVTTEILFSHWEIMNPSCTLHQHTYSKILTFQTLYCPKNQGCLSEVTFSREVDVPVFESFVTADTEEPFSGLIFSIVWVLCIPGTLGTEPTVLLAFFILGCLFVMHLQTNLRTQKKLAKC